jgi:very-short-patch-repair endonuclease
VESRGANLGEVARVKPELNGFERDVRDRLVAAGIPLVAQHGSSGQWIDFAAAHPTQPERMVLAIECDGATYRASATARDRERLRREHLQRLGWTFHRIWSTDWFRDRDAEIARAKAAYEGAVAAADRAAQPTPQPAATAAPTATTAPAPSAATATRRGPRPRFISSAGVPIDEYSHEQLVTVIRWIESDTLLRTEDELLEDAMQELGYERRGPRILAALTAAIVEARKTG